jgi:hypothetical protein
MTTGKPIAAILGFAFIAMWIATNLGDAVLCLLGAAIFYLATGVFAGEIDLGELQGRLTTRQNTGSQAYATPPRRTTIQ